MQPSPKYQWRLPQLKGTIYTARTLWALSTCLRCSSCHYQYSDDCYYQLPNRNPTIQKQFPFLISRITANHEHSNSSPTTTDKSAECRRVGTRSAQQLVMLVRQQAEQADLQSLPEPDNQRLRSHTSASNPREVAAIWMASGGGRRVSTCEARV